MSPKRLILIVKIKCKSHIIQATEKQLQSSTVLYVKVLIFDMTQYDLNN